MSEEEKKAMETTKILIEFSGDNYIPKQNREKLQILLNLIEKQQKEIEEWRNGIRINDKVSIPKDIIRAKIQKYKDKKADSIGMLINYEIWKAKIEILQELLGDDKNE